MPNIRLHQSRANRFVVQYRDFQGITLKKIRTVIPFPSPQTQYCVKGWIYTTFLRSESIPDTENTYCSSIRSLYDMHNL